MRDEQPSLSHTLIDLSLRRDLHLTIVLEVTASVPESFVEIGVWGWGKKELIRSLMERKAMVCASACVASFLSVLTAEGMLCPTETLVWGLNNS